VVRGIPGGKNFMNGSISVDTNVLVYSRDASKLDKQALASEWISHLWKSRAGRLSVQVIAEYYAVVTGKLKPGPSRIFSIFRGGTLLSFQRQRFFNARTS